MSERPVAEKLLIRPGRTVWVSDPGRLALLGPLPEGALVVADLAEAAVAVAIVDDGATARRVLDAEGTRLAAAEVFWVLYPKGGRADINRDSLWPIVAEYGMRPITQVAVDEAWSALRFRPLKAGELGFAGGR